MIFSFVTNHLNFRFNLWCLVWTMFWATPDLVGINRAGLCIWENFVSIMFRSGMGLPFIEVVDWLVGCGNFDFASRNWCECIRLLHHKVKYFPKYFGRWNYKISLSYNSRCQFWYFWAFRFTEELFATLIAFIFIFNAFRNLVHIGTDNKFAPSTLTVIGCHCIQNDTVIDQDTNVWTWNNITNKDECVRHGGTLVSCSQIKCSKYKLQITHWYIYNILWKDISIIRLVQSVITTRIYFWCLWCSLQDPLQSVSL